MIIKALIPSLANRHALTKGRSVVGDANQMVEQLGDGDVVFVDPPYSSVHYSRFYHVLETVARGACGPVSGVGRYPPTPERPKSDYSIKSRALPAMLDLLEQLSGNRCSVILTFPAETASNGMSGRELIKQAGQWFRVNHDVVISRFSTMGGSENNRGARQPVEEMIAVMTPI